MRVGVVHHLGWAVAVAAVADGTVLLRERLDLVEEGLPPAPIHHHGGTHPMHTSGAPLDDEDLATLVSTVRRSVERATSTALAGLEAAAPQPITALAVRAWPANFPEELTTLRRPPYESRADSFLYCQVLAAEARSRGWAVHRFDPKTVEAEAAAISGPRAAAVVAEARAHWGPPWTKDHRIALAAAICAS